MPIYGGWCSPTATTSTTGNYVYMTVIGTSASTAPTYCTGYNQQAARALYYYQAQAAAYDPRPAQQAQQTRSHSPEAKKRALDLLLENLTPEQQKTFEEKKWFVVEGGKSKTQYRIRAKDDLVANIDVIDGERTKHRLCGHCNASKVPLGDQLLAQKVMLEFAEDDFLRVANRHAA